MRRARRFATAAKWNPAAYLAFGEPRLQPAADLISRVALDGKKPAIADVGCGTGAPTRLLRQTWPDAPILCVDNSADMLAACRDTLELDENVRFKEADFDGFAKDNESFDLVFSNAALHWADDAPSLISRLLTSKVRPGGLLAVQIPDTRAQRSHQLFGEVAESLGLAERLADVRVPSNQHDAAVYFDRLLGPLCESLECWTTTYVQVLKGDDPVFRFVRETGMQPVLAALGDADAVDVFEAEYKRRAAEEYPKRKDGTTLFPFTRFFLIARRPGLMDLYAEYSAYHDHQLEKGWKS